MSAFDFITELVMSSGTLTPLLTLILIVSLTLYIHFAFYKYSDEFMQMVNRIPGPRCYPIIGSAYIFGTDPKDILQNVADYSAQYGDVSRHWIGPLLYVCIHKVGDLEMILGNSNMLSKTSANELMKSLVGESIITHSETWKKHRKLLQPTFHSQILKDYVKFFISKSTILNQLLESQLDQQDFDICPFTNNFSYDILCETLLATKSDEQKSGKQSQFVSSLTISAAIMTCRFYKPWMYVDYVFYKTQSGKVFRSHTDFLHDTIKKIIQTKKEKMKTQEALKTEGQKDGNGKVKRKSFLDYLLKTSSEDALSDREVLEESKGIIAAGFDTTSAAIGLLCFVLSRRFDIQEKIIEEVKEVLGTLDDVPFTYEDVQNFKYLERVVKETLRLYPTVPYVARQVTEDTKLPSGYTLPSGCGVVMTFMRLHRDPELYPEPHVFDPDNFLPERVAERHTYSYCPFSAGPRNCIGQRYAMLQLKTFTVCLLRRFWLTPSDVKLELMSKITMISRTGVKVGLKERTTERPFVKDYDRLSKSASCNIPLLNIQFKDSYL